MVTAEQKTNFINKIGPIIQREAKAGPADPAR